MTAYEFAEMMIVHDGSQLWEHAEAIANMLRQQADRIAKLEGELSRYEMRDLEHTSRIAELEKEVKELHKIAQVIAMQESDARKSLQNYKDVIE